MKRALHALVTLAALLLAAAAFHVVANSFEEVAARRIVKACHQDKQFTVGKETFGCGRREAK